jgi:hypothetical protein
MHMGHFISNLQIYLQLDVVEVNYARLQDKVAAAQVSLWVCLALLAHSEDEHCMNRSSL